MESRNRSNTQNDGIKQTENLYNVILENLEKTMLFVSESGLHHFSCHASKQRNCFTVKVKNSRFESITRVNYIFKSSLPSCQTCSQWFITKINYMFGS